MRFPKWGRKRKTIRNLVVAVLLLFLTAWLWDFPVWTAEQVLHRGEREYLLEDAELLFVSEEDSEGTVYGRSGELLLAVNYSRSPLGLHPGFIRHYKEPDGIHCTTRDWWPLEVMAFGALEEAHRAELEIAVHWDGSTDDRRWDLQRTYRMEGLRKNPYCFTFAMEPFYPETDPGPEAEMEREFFDRQGPNFTYHAVLRLWDEAGALLREKQMDYMNDERTLAW